MVRPMRPSINRVPTGRLFFVLCKCLLSCETPWVMSSSTPCALLTALLARCSHLASSAWAASCRVWCGNVMRCGDGV